MSRRYAFGSSYKSILNPQEIFGVNLFDWYDFTDDSTLTKTGVLIDAIDSKATGSSRQFTASGATRPDVVTGQINSLQIARFDGVSEYMEIPSSLGTFNFLHNNANGGMVMLICKVTSDTGVSQFLIGNNFSSSTLIGYGISTNSTKHLQSFIARGVSGDRTSRNDTISAMYSDYISYNIFADIVDPNNGTAADRSKINSNFGSYVQNNVQTFTPSVLTASGQFTIGKNPSASSNYASIDLAEAIVVSDQPSAGELTLLQTYIEDKYGGTFPI